MIIGGIAEFWIEIAETIDCTINFREFLICVVWIV